MCPLYLTQKKVIKCMDKKLQWLFATQLIFFFKTKNFNVSSLTCSFF